MRAIDADALKEDCKRYLGTLNPDKDGKECTRIHWLIGVLENAPTIDPEPCEDTVSRKAAIDALMEEVRLVDGYYVENDEVIDKDDAIEAIRLLPSAQSEPCEDAVSREAVSSWLKQYGQDVLHGKYKFSLMYIWKNLMDLPSVQHEQHWIPVSERLPDEYGEYLVTKHTIGWNCEEYVSNDIAYFDNDGFHKADMVIAWMSLPEPYRAERRTDELGDK